MTIKEHLIDYVLEKYPGKNPESIFLKFDIETRLTLFDLSITERDKQSGTFQLLKSRVDGYAEEVKNGNSGN